MTRILAGLPLGRSRRVPEIPLPDLPGSLLARVEVVQVLFLLESVHTRPESIKFLSEQFLLENEALKGLEDDLVAFAHVVEDFPAERKVSAVHSDAGAGEFVYAAHPRRRSRFRLRGSWSEA